MSNILTPSYDEDLYQAEWLGESLEQWLDAIEDMGAFELSVGEEKALKRKKGIMRCMSSEASTLEEGVQEVKKVLEFISDGLDGFQLHYTLIMDDEGNSAEKSCYYVDEDGNDSPTNNFHADKWGSQIGVKF